MAEITYRQALHDCLREELLRDDSVFLVGEEIGNFEGSYKITAGLLKEFGPTRVVDTPIVENGFVGIATVLHLRRTHPGWGPDTRLGGTAGRSTLGTALLAQPLSNWGTAQSREADASLSDTQ